MLVAVELLGRTRVLADGREVPFSRQCMAFLAYLILKRDVDHPREELIERFWAEQEPKRARSSLGSALSRLKRALRINGTSYLELSTRGEPRISEVAPIWFDVAAFEAGIRLALSPRAGLLEPEIAAQLAASLSYYRGDLLVGWYDDWVLAERERLRLLCLRGYRQLMEHCAAAGDYDRAITAGQSAVAMEPLQENVQRRMIELYALSGERGAALRHYRNFEEILASELGVAPDGATRALVDRLRRQEHA